MNEEYLVTWRNRPFFESVFSDRFFKSVIKSNQFVIDGLVLSHEDKVDSSMLRVNAHINPILTCFVPVMEGIEEAKFRTKSALMPSLSVSGEWLHSGGFYPGRLYDIECEHHIVILQPRGRDNSRLFSSTVIKEEQVAKLYLEGKWLYDQGFYVGFFARLDMYPSCLMMRPIKNLNQDKISYNNWLDRHGKSGTEHFEYYYNSLSEKQKISLL